MIILLNLCLNYIYDIMENIIIDLRIKIQELEQENKDAHKLCSWKKTEKDISKRKVAYRNCIKKIWI